MCSSQDSKGGPSTAEGRPSRSRRRKSEDCRSTGLDRAADGAQDLADLAAQEDEGDDRDDRDEREDQRVLGETLALVIAMEPHEE